MVKQQEPRKTRKPISGHDEEPAHTPVPNVMVDPARPQAETHVPLPDPDPSLPSQDEEIAK
jgi:hypothetical protein